MHRYRRLLQYARRQRRFFVLISLLTTLALARAFVLLTGAANTTTETSSYIGRNLIIGGYHIHHFFYGFALICAAAWIAIQYPHETCRAWPRPSSAEVSVFAWTRWDISWAGK